jgi:hypothetical protein
MSLAKIVREDLGYYPTEKLYTLRVELTHDYGYTTRIENDPHHLDQDIEIPSIPGAKVSIHIDKGGRFDDKNRVGLSYLETTDDDKIKELKKLIGELTK